MSTEITLTPKLLIFDWHGTLADGAGDLLPGIAQTLTTLKKHFILALATSMSQAHIQILLTENRIEQLFTTIQTGDMGFQKPDPGMLFAVLAATDQQPEAALMIGDSVADIVMANDANVPVVAVLSGSDNKMMLEFAKPQWILNDVNELLTALRVKT